MFRLASTDNLGLYVLPKLLASLRKKAPAIDLRVRALPEDWSGALQRGELDLKLGRKSALHGPLVQQELSQERFACVVRRGHPVRAKPSLREWAALEHLVVTPTAAADASGVVDALLAQHGLTRRIALSVPHFMVAPHVIASSDLVLTAPERLLAPFVRSLKLRVLRTPLRLPEYALSQVWATRSDHDEAHRWLRRAIAETLVST
jgi:DNA-binding transcriptional LysR family regulator